MTNTYERLGNYPIIEEVDLLNLVSAANRSGDTRVGGDSAGKRKGKEAFVRLTSDDTVKKVIALGDESSAAWRVVDGSAEIVPVNILSAGGGIAWTVAAGCTYSAGLLVADGVDDPTASQVVALKAGTYRIYGSAAAENDSTDVDAPRLQVTGATDGELINKYFTGAIHPTAAESADPKETISETFTLTVNQNVTFELTVVDGLTTGAGDPEAGSAYIKIDKLEAE